MWAVQDDKENITYVLAMQWYFFTVLTKAGDKLSTMLQFDDVKEMWKYFTTTGLPGQGKAGLSPVSKFAIHFK